MIHRGEMSFGLEAALAMARVMGKVRVAIDNENARAARHLEYVHRSLGQKFRQVREHAHRELQDYDGSIFWLKP